MKPTLVFVYNADSGLFNTLTDIAHKLLSPATYKCNLCAITHSASGMRKEWRAFLDSLPYPMEFLHRDELEAQTGGMRMQLPAILLKRGGTFEEWIGAEEIDGCASMEELRELILSHLPELTPKTVR